MLRRLCVLILAGSLWLPAFAHQQKAAITKVLFNSRTGHIEVMHRFYMHDAEHAVGEIFGGKADIMKSAETQQQFADYVTERFELLQQDKGLPLSLVGFELEGKFFWVYQETPIPVELTNLSVRHNALRDIWPSQVNLVNIEGREELKSLTFHGSAELLKVEF
ncbi:hypothetical protein P2G88_00285 [Aliiglaciecola sp. CAU 1673]|uniref:DUF6702 family protein n=1 Tax=Aliiglaciecola sp. CAU 1673 TaxID=3032595 RepID=UPI0023DC68E7|nr:DUF6702 family protein [Aliiglaciecola sp. CAU 1673]MDF2176684.1 hypothetical protein [Aliiglaciecola sp. CAU 1673]